jgi:hypothetical protein
VQNELRRGVSGQPQHDKARVIRRRVVADIAEAEIARNEAERMTLRVRSNAHVICGTEPDVANVRRVMAKTPDQFHSATRQIGINEESHSEYLCRQRVEFFLLDELIGKGQGGSDIIDRYVVFRLDLFERHASRETAHDPGHGRACPTNDRFAMLDLWVD